MTTPREWTSREVRETFLSFFEKKGHQRVASSPLVPAEDPTLLFTNAGMNQFKDVFLGRESRPYSRAATVQKCVRAGGKHNDLDNVGYTARHHTFFEMLGNFSFGDYFKRDAIDYAWELVTSPEYYGMAKDRLWATVYKDDDEAAELWLEYLPKERIARFGEKDNFWAMGDTGPCGPCSELHYDQGEGVPGDSTPNGRGDRVIEIWNLVFMQYERDASGTLNPLPKPSVDTGAGLERITAILSGKNNNYDTDLFASVIRILEEATGKKYRGGMAVEDAPFRVIADHIRASTMLISDGVMPSNEGRGYVLRRILRRAIRYGRRLGLDKPFLCDGVDAILGVFAGVHFPDPVSPSIGQSVRDQIGAEETRFAKTMSVGADRVGEAISEARRHEIDRLSGEQVFKFYDTFGIPLELIEELAGDEGVGIDRTGFAAELEKARERSKAGSKFEADASAIPEEKIDPSWTTEFRGYPEDDFVKLADAKVLALFGFAKPGEAEGPLAVLSAGREGLVIADRTVFYPEGGGQVSDEGTFSWDGGRAKVASAHKGVTGSFVLHHVRVEEGELRAGSQISMEVPEWTRRRTQANHTGTHLLHAALRKVLGDTVRQMGSLVASERLRFDYSAARATTPSEIVEIERLVNEEILRDTEVSKEQMHIDEARSKGAMMFFGEKYGERVRVVDVPGFSTELCGGCHVRRTGEIGGLKVTSDRALAAGVRRIEAVTALGLIERLAKGDHILAEVSEIVQVPHEDVAMKVREISARLRELEKEIAKLKVALASSGASGSQSEDAGIVEIGGIRVLSRRVAPLPMNELRNLADTFRGKVKSGVVLIGTEVDGKVTLIAAVTKDLVERLPANEFAQKMAVIVGGKGGGKADLAQAGGKDGARIEEALAAGVNAVREKLGGGA